MPKLLIIIDEIGYLPFGREQSNLFSAQLLTRDEAQRIGANITQTFLALSFQTR